VKRYLIAAALIIGGLLIPTTAHATVVTPACGMPTGWYANADEQDRLPTPTPGGLKFEGNDLIHHATTGTVESLAHGTFWAGPAPDQDSFFSVEVSGSDGGYGTLRWNTTTAKWNLVTGGQFYENASPAALVDMPPVHRSHDVVSFGVGYTANPPGTVTTTVRSVRFGGHTYDLRCKPPVKPRPSHTSASPSPSASHSVSPTTKPPTTSADTSPSPSRTAVAAGAGGNGGTGALAVTGPPVGLIGWLALALVSTGGLAYLAARRRKTRFTA
jgi:hypothetical protein